MNAQELFTPEKLWEIKRVSALGISKDLKSVIYAVGTPNIEANKIDKKYYEIPITGGAAAEITNTDAALLDKHISKNGKYKIYAEEVKLLNVTGKDFYPDMHESKVKRYDDLMYRHWDTWEDGNFSHVFVTNLQNGSKTDIMSEQMYNCPTQPFGDDSDFIFSPDETKIIYVTKQKKGKEYATSTNTDIFEYDIEHKTTKNLTENNKGYDVNPTFSSQGTLAWLSMERDGYEADKQDIKILKNGKTFNLTAYNDLIHVENYKWANDGKSIYFIAPINGTLQLFQVFLEKEKSIKQLTSGDFDITSIVGQVENQLIVTKTDMNHATEIYTFHLKNQSLIALTTENKAFYKQIASCKTERRWVKTIDGKQMLVWVIFPPNFDASKKYPTLLYCQGGPQSPLTQFYSFRWNFQLMASQGYIVVAPSRRGMQGFGTEWNEQVSKDWGGLVMQDYLYAIDNISQEQYVDKERLGCIGASFGGFSVFSLAGIHENRFKTFISHAGIFDFRSMYGTTEEMFFENWEKGGSYWEIENQVAQKSFATSPSNFVQNWNTPILIIQGEKDYRVPESQAFQAFQAAQLRGIKSRLLLFEEENHWILKPQNALVWQHEFYKWLQETL